MIGDMLAKVVISMQGDTSDLVKKIREVQGEEKKLAEEQLKQAKARNEQLENWANGITVVKSTFSAFHGVAKFIWDEYKAQAEKARLQTAAFGVDLDLLGKAALGTKSKMDLLRDAAAMNNGVFKLTSQEMATVEKAMIALNRRGFETEDVHKKVLEAVTQLKTDGLRDLGIAVDKYGASLETADGRAKIFAATMGEITKVAGGVKDATLTLAEETDRATARMENAWKKFKREWIFGPAQIGGTTVDIATYVTDEEYQRKVTHAILEQQVAAAAAGKSLEDYAADMQKAIDAQARMIQVMDVQRQRHGFKPTTADDLAAMAKAGLAAGRMSGSGGRAKPVAVGYTLGDTEYGSTSAVVGGLGGIGDTYGGYGNVTTGMINTASWAAELESYRAGQNEKGGMIEKIFGPVDTITATDVALQGLHGTFSAFTDALTAGFGAWIDGSKSATAAFKETLAQGLKSTAMEMFAQSIKHAAYAIGAFAIGGPLAGMSAAAHLKAAAAFAAGAATIGTMAKGVGTSGSSSTGASPGGGVPAYSGGGNSQGGGGQTIVAVLGPDFSQDSSRARQVRAAKILEDAKAVTGNGAVRYP